MNNNLVKEITARQLRTDIPSFRSGDTIKVYVRIIENKKERNQVFEGVVMQRRGSGVSATFTVRKISSGIGVERTFPVNAPSIASIEVVKHGKVRRNKITYMRKLSGKAAASQKHGAADITSVNASAISGVIASANLPSFVDDVVEGYLNGGKFYKEKKTDGTYATEITAESGKIYINLNDSKTYRWSGSAYVVISETIALGETSSTAYRGDRGKTAYDHAAAKGSAFASGLYKITTNAQGHVTAATAVQKSDITALGIPAQDTVYTHPTSSGNKHIPSGGSAGQFLKWSADGTAVWAADNNTTYSNFKGATSSAAGGSGLVPAPATGAANRYLRSDGTWQVPPDNNTWTALKGATTDAAGTAGYVAAPAKGQQGYFLRGDATWAAISKGTVGLGNVDNTADSNKSVKYAASAGSASSATKASTADSATKATQDSAGQQINTTYIKGLSVSGRTVTYTRGDGTTGTITTQDTNTTYNALTNDEIDAAFAAVFG